MKIILRGIPNFTHLQQLEVEDLQMYLGTFELGARDSIGLGYRCEYFTRTSTLRPRVSVYIEAVEGNRKVLESRCFLPPKPEAFRRSTSMSCCYLVTDASLKLLASGTDSAIRTDKENVFYMVEPGLDPRAAVVLEEARKERKRRIKEEEEREELLEQQSFERFEKIEQLVRVHGHLLVMSMLRGLEK